MSASVGKLADPWIYGKSFLLRFWILGAMMVVWILFGMFTKVVPAGHVGVVRKLGNIQDSVLPEGLSTLAPFINAVQTMPFQVQRLQLFEEAFSKNQQTVKTTAIVTFYLNKDMAPDILRKVGLVDDVAMKVVKPAFQETIKAVTGVWTTESMTLNRVALKADLLTSGKSAIQRTLESKQLKGAIVIANVAIQNFEFSREFMQSIEDKVKAEQAALQAQNEKLLAITRAEAENEKQRIEANAQAVKVVQEGNAKAAAVALEAANLKSNTDLIQLRLIELWDGNLPEFARRRRALSQKSHDNVLKETNDLLHNV